MTRLTKATVPADFASDNGVVAGTTYEILAWVTDNPEGMRNLFVIRDSDGDEVVCATVHCAFLDGRDWILS